jgi:HTH-type transcriptional regulator/antitoxin HigA
VNQIITGTKAITPQTAQGIAAAFGTTAELWLNLESAYRLEKERTDQDAVSRRAKLYEIAPVKEMISRRWIQDSDNINILESTVAEFFAEPFEAAARKSTSYETTTPAQRAWMYQARYMARKLTVPVTFDARKAKDRLPELHALTVSEHEARRIPSMLANMGIRLVIVKPLQGSHIDGATFWLDEDSPVIALSLRFDRIDSVWFTLCHELSHVIHGDKWSIDTDIVGPDRIGGQDIPECEQRANQEASEFLIPKAKLDSFIMRHRPRFSKVNIVRFANLHQIHPGIVVGQLQHRDAIKYSHSREMLASVRTALTDAALTDGWGHSTSRN